MQLRQDMAPLNLDRFKQWIRNWVRRSYPPLHVALPSADLMSIDTASIRTWPDVSRLLPWQLRLVVLVMKTVAVPNIHSPTHPSFFLQESLNVSGSEGMSDRQDVGNHRIRFSIIAWSQITSAELRIPRH